MAGKSKKLKKLEDHHRYLNKKVAELTEDRKTDRSSESKSILMRLKKTKLAIKTAFSELVYLGKNGCQALTITF